MRQRLDPGAAAQRSAYFASIRAEERSKKRSKKRSVKVTHVPAPEDDDPPPKKPPKFCPWCGHQVIKRWAPHKMRTLYQRPRVMAIHVCLACKVAVRAFKFPAQPLFETKRAARDEAQRAYATLEASGFRSVYAQELYQRGKCGCNYARQPFAKIEPCAVHAPLRKKRA